MKKYLYLIKNAKIPTYIKYWLMYSSKKVQATLQSLPLMLESTIKDTIIKITKIYGNTEQATSETSPSPDFPSPVNNITGDVEVKVQDKNLAWNGWAEDFVTRVNNSNFATITTYENRNCLSYSASAGYGDYNNKYMFKTNWKQNTQYTLSYYAKSSQGYLNLSIEYTDGTSSSIDGTVISNWNRVLITSSANKTIKYVRARYVGGNTYIDLDTFMVVEGTTAGEYIPHQEQNYPISLGDIELCKIGMAQDYIYKENGNWYKYGAIGKVVLDGSESINGSVSGNYFVTYQRLTNLKPATSNNIPENILSNYFTAISKNNWESSTVLKEGVGVSESGLLLFKILSSRLTATTSTAFKNWLSTNNVTVEYQLATPTTTQITDTTLINQLEAIQNIKAYEDITNISSDKEIKIDIDYIQRG